MGGGLSSRFFKMDFTRDELLLFPLVEAPLHAPYSDCRSRSQTLRVYSAEEILAEKLCALHLDTVIRETNRWLRRTGLVGAPT